MAAQPAGGMGVSILQRLEHSKGIVSPAPGKLLANEVLAGDTTILEEAVGLLGHQDKMVRAGAGKTIEQVSTAEPGLVAGYLPQLLPSLQVPEPQTRWMVLHALGCCAGLDPGTALEALPRAEAFAEGNSGACLWGATVVYLGYAGSTLEANVRAVYPNLESAAQAPEIKKGGWREICGCMTRASPKSGLGWRSLPRPA